MSYPTTAHELRQEATRRWRDYSKSRGGNLTKKEYEAFHAGFSQGYTLGLATPDQPTCNCGAPICNICYPLVDPVTK